MCGFVMVCGVRVETPQLVQSLKAIQHRGPDSLDIWQNGDKTVSFGHVRLSIIDLNGGVQPLQNGDGSLTAVVNGEFYDYKRIREELASSGYRFKTSSDSEILLALYERYGTQCLKHLRGEFAFVLWDAKNQLVFAARDYFGIKPLFYTVQDNAIYFASELKAFTALSIPMRWDEESFYQTLTMFPQPDSTLLEGIVQIPPAHFLVKSAHNRTPRTQAYWDLDYPKKDTAKPQQSEKAWIDGLRNVLTESIQLRQQADVPVACYLSGGLDSCSILGFAQSFSSQPVHAFTLTFDHGDYNEFDQAQEMAAFSNSPFHPIAISQDDIVNHLEAAVWHGERFIVNGHGVAKFLLSKAVRDAGFKVVLTGEGSDEIFAGYAHFRQDQIQHGSDQSAEVKAEMLQELVRTNKVSNGFLLAEETSSATDLLQSQIGFVPGWVQSFGLQRQKVDQVLAGSISEKYAHRNHIAFAFNQLNLLQQVQNREELHQALYLWTRTMLPHYLLTILGDRMEMAHSIEGRLPFLDHKVVEYVVQMPTHLKIKGMTEKYALREAAKHVITDTIYKRQKHPFLAPPAFVDRQGNALATLIQDSLRSQNLTRIPFIDQKSVIGLLDSLPNMTEKERGSWDILLMSLVSACFMQKRFNL